MKSLKALQTLSDLSSRNCEEAATRLDQAKKLLEQNKQKLSLLEEYRNTYATQLQTQLSQGLNVSSYCNFQQFLLTLESAIDQQNQQVLHCLHRVDIEHKNWQACERKRLSYNLLGQRAQLAIQHQLNKQEQKDTDEYASRAKLLKL
jgi:flagellar FliJ protein